jgi:hypothetical protein
MAGNVGAGHIQSSGQRGQGRDVNMSAVCVVALSRYQLAWWVHQTEVSRSPGEVRSGSAGLGP